MGCGHILNASANSLLCYDLHHSKWALLCLIDSCPAHMQSPGCCCT